MADREKLHKRGVFSGCVWSNGSLFKANVSCRRKRDGRRHRELEIAKQEREERQRCKIAVLLQR